jgi:hypothetical protein
MGTPAGSALASINAGEFSLKSGTVVGLSAILLPIGVCGVKWIIPLFRVSQLAFTLDCRNMVGGGGMHAAKAARNLGSLRNPKSAR